MKKLYILSLVIILAFTAIILPGCKKEPGSLSSYSPIGDTKLDSLRLFNLLPDLSGDGLSTGYLIYLNDSLINYRGLNENYGLSYGVAPSIALTAKGGTFDIKLTQYPMATYPYGTILPPPAKNPAASAIVMEKKITIPPHSGFGQIVFYDNGGQPAMQYLPVSSADPGAPSPGKFKIRLINFSYDMADSGPSYPANSAGAKFAIQMQNADSTIVSGMNNIPFASVSNYQQLDYGTLQFLIYNTTNSKYLTNSGPLNDVLSTFDLSPLVTYPGTVPNYLFPNAAYLYSGGDFYTLNYGNIGSYPFIAGGCYTVLVIGNMYAVSLDRQYNPGVADNFGKVQVVNANPNQQDMGVKITYSGGQSTIASLPFGKSADPLTVPAGNVTLTFSSQGKTVYTYNAQVPRLGNFTYYYCSDLKELPFIFPESNTITADDYTPASYSSPAVYEYCKVGVLDLCADAGNVFFTQQSSLTGGLDVKMFQGNSAADDFYKEATSSTRIIYDGTTPPTGFNLRLSASRIDSLASQKVATLTPAFKSLPAPGTYTLTAAGLLNTTDPAKKIKLIMVKHTNIVSKSN